MTELKGTKNSAVMMVSRVLIVATAAILGLGLVANVWADSKAPVVLELFTSQGCSSCPPADKLLRQLAQRDDVIALSRPVQYWDRLGWKDTLATPENTQLQYAYADQWRTRRVYTPQLVVNGITDVVGSRADRIAALIDTQQAQSHADISLSTRVGDSGTIEVRLSGTPRVPTLIKLLRLRADETVNVERGENAQRQLHYINSVASEVVLAHWAGGDKTLQVSSAQLQSEQADRWVILVQMPGPGRILTAQYLNLPE